MDALESNTLSTPINRKSSQFASSTPMNENVATSELSSLQKEIDSLKEFIQEQDNQRKRPSRIRILCGQLWEKFYQSCISYKGKTGSCWACFQNFPNCISFRFIFNAMALISFIFVLASFDDVPILTKGPHSLLRRHRGSRSYGKDPYTVIHNGYVYRALRPDVEVDAFDNPYLQGGRSVLTCPVRFPVPDGWTLVPEDDIPDVIINVVSNHYWSSSAMILNKFAAYPTLSLRSQVARPYPQATNEAKTLTQLTNEDPFEGMGPWFDVSNVNDNDWVIQNLLPVNTRECLMIVFSFASRGYRDDHVEDVVPACELCSANILIRKSVYA